MQKKKKQREKEYIATIEQWQGLFLKQHQIKNLITKQILEITNF